MFNITDDIIKDVCSNFTTYIRGKKYYSANRIRSLTFDNENLIFNAVVSGTENYLVKIAFNSHGDLKDASCTCPAYDKYWGYCKHIASVLEVIKERNNKGEFKKYNENNIATDIMDFFRYRQNCEKEPVNLEVTYEFEPNINGYANIQEASFLSLRMGTKKLYVVKSIKKTLESFKNREKIYYGKEFTFDPERNEFRKEDQPIINLLTEIFDNEKYLNSSLDGYGNKSLFKGKRVSLTSSVLKRFFSLVKERKFNALILNTLYKDIQVVENDIPLEFELNKKKDDLLLKINSRNNPIPLIFDGEYFFVNDRIYKVSKYQKENFAPIYNAFTRERSNTITIPQKFSERFVSEVFPYVKKIGKISIDEKVESSFYKPEIKPEIYLDRHEDMITGDVKFVYGDIIINPFSKNRDSHKSDKILLRDPEKEKEIMNLFERYEFKVNNDKIHLDDEEKIFDFVYYGIPKLQEKAKIYYSEAFRNLKVKNISSFSGGVKLDSDRDLLEFNFSIEGIDSSELRDVFISLKEKKKFYRLKDGSFLPLDMDELAKIGQVVDYLDLTEKELEKDFISLPKFKALYLDEHLKDSKLNYMERNLEFKELVLNIKEPNDIDYNIPDELKGVLRDYQVFGFKWLKTLTSYGFGGILADDMGLGKTLQILTFILSEKMGKGGCPSLIVAPTSLLYNWLAEIEKFTPSLKALIVSGNKNERRKSIENIHEYDIVITSYPLIRRDIDLYEDISFRCCILDEAQHIKNSASQNAKSVKWVKAKNRFALTGTPIENSLTELWSIFDFIMSGYLFSNTKFKKRFEGPIVKNQDQTALDELRKHINPFILRRLKKDVLTELPEKIEHKISAELTREQKKIYLAYLKKIKGEIEEEIEIKGFGRSHIKILSGLTRLRQVCCHPSVFIENFKGESGKLQLLEEIVDDCVDGGHRILLFSQFTSMLKIIKDMLISKEIEYLYLDGSTDTKKRGVLVNDFNEGRGKIFLISLKAGGTGLNLTGADTVIHFDPWWNPAVEEQATDRAYRIGQKNPVHVMKLITKGTIEEKIFKLQEKKRKMIDAVIKPGETLLSRMTEEQIREIFELDAV